MTGPPNLETTLLDYPWVVVRFRCHYCERGGDARLVACAVRYGSLATLHRLLDAFISGCPWDPHSELRKPQKYGTRCGAYLPDIGRSGPPDLPPSLTGLKVVEGGKDERLPSERTAHPRRRRIGGDDE